jgi:hypothetical protein
MFYFWTKKSGKYLLYQFKLQCILNSKKFLHNLEKISNLRLTNEILLFLEKLNKGETLSSKNKRNFE